MLWLTFKKEAYMLLENFHLVLSDHLDKPKRNTGQFKNKWVETLEKVKGKFGINPILRKDEILRKLNYTIQDRIAGKGWTTI